MRKPQSLASKQLARTHMNNVQLLRFRRLPDTASTSETS